MKTFEAIGMFVGTAFSTDSHVVPLAECETVRLPDESRSSFTQCGAAISVWFVLKLVPSVTAYMRWDKGPKQRIRFTKTGDPKLEEAYARQFVWPGKGPFHPPATRRAAHSEESMPYDKGIGS